MTRSGLVALLCFFFNDTATTEIYTLSLHDALPICWVWLTFWPIATTNLTTAPQTDRKSTRLNSSHLVISYAVFCLKKKIERKLMKPESETSRSRVSGRARGQRCETC